MDENIILVNRIYSQANKTERRLLLRLCDLVCLGTDAERDALEKAMKLPDYERSREIMLEIVNSHEIIDPDIRRILTA